MASPTVNLAALEQEYLEACLDSVAECQRRFRYKPQIFLQMVEDYGVVETTRRLVEGPMPEGYEKLWRWGALNLTLEGYLHDNPRFHPLFGAQTLAAADRRLHDCGYF